MHFRGDTALQFGAFARYSDSRHTGLIAIQHSFLSSVLTIFTTGGIKIVRRIRRIIIKCSDLLTYLRFNYIYITLNLCLSKHESRLRSYETLKINRMACREMGIQSNSLKWIVPGPTQ